MGQSHLDRAIKLALDNKQDIEQTYRHSSNSAVNIYTTIANSKYGVCYCEIVNERLFGDYDDEHVVNYLDVWDSACKENNKKITLHDSNDYSA